MDHFARLPASERATVFRETAARPRLGSATIIEKDFWVCWTLQRIFSSPMLPGPLFKGGTSLSKVYKVIERFSEDVDIVLDRHALGFIGAEDPANIAGTNRRNRKLDELAGKCSVTVRGAVLDELQKSFATLLGESDWKLSEDPADADRQSLLSPIRSVWSRICTAWARTSVPSFAWSSDAAATSGRPSSSRSSRTSLMHFLASWVNRLQKSTFSIRNAHSGRRPRYCTLSSIRARCRPGFRGITMTSRVCTGTITDRLRSRTSGCLQVSSSTRKSSSGKSSPASRSRAIPASDFGTGGKLNRKQFSEFVSSTAGSRPRPPPQQRR